MERIMTMYQEIKGDTLDPIFEAIKDALTAKEPLSVTLNKHGNGYEAVLVQVADEPPPPIPV